jgi:hypothetical protein
MTATIVRTGTSRWYRNVQLSLGPGHTSPTGSNSAVPSDALILASG